MVLTEEDFNAMEKLDRVQLATTLPGPKPICLVGTRSNEGATNLAPFSSITHLGSTPILMGMVTRPDTVERHTLQNIIDTGSWTLNHVTSGMVKQAHQCSARYPGSEFEATGLNEIYHDGIIAPFVEESAVRFALELEDLVDIPSNGTKLIVGRVIFAEVPDTDLDLIKAGTLASTALDTYFSLNEVARLPYARP